MRVQILVIAAVFFLDACGGNAGAPQAQPPVAEATAAPAAKIATLNFIAKLPKSVSAAQTKRHRAAFSPATESVSIVLVSNNGTAATNAVPFDANITAASPSCVPDTSNDGLVDCTISAPEPVGTDVFTVTAYDEPGVTGDAIATGSVTASVPASGTANVPLVLGGIPASMQVLVLTPTVTAGATITTNVSVAVEDASGAAILGNDAYTSPIALTLADPQHLGTLSTTRITSNAVISTLTVDAAGVASGSLSIGASAPGVAASAVTSATVTISNDRNWTDGATFHYVGSSSETVSGPNFATTTYASDVTSDETIATAFSTSEPYAIARNVSTTTTAVAPSAQPVTTSALYHYALVGDFATTDLNEVDVTTTDATSSTNATTFAAAATVDELPEAAGLTWYPSDAFGATFMPSQSSTQPAQSYTENGDGTYAYTDAYADGDTSSAAFTPVNELYTYDLANGTDLTYTIGSPAPNASGSAATIAISETIASPAPSTSPSAAATPSASATPIATAAPDWIAAAYASGAPLVSDVFQNLGPASLPSACNVPATLGTTANHIQESYADLDPISGVALSETNDFYIISGVGIACRQTNETENVYYDLALASSPMQSLSSIFPGTLLATYVITSVSGLQSTGSAQIDAARRAAMFARPPRRRAVTRAGHDVALARGRASVSGPDRFAALRLFLHRDR